MTDLVKVTSNRNLIKANALAVKNNCSVDYVNKVLRGDREAKSELASKIIQDALKVLDALGV